MFRSIHTSNLLIKKSKSVQLNAFQKRNLNIHEYQAKSLMKKYNVDHQRGFILRSVDEVESVSQRVKNELKSENMILKAQILAGGRGKGVFDTGFKGGVKFCPS